MRSDTTKPCAKAESRNSSNSLADNRSEKTIPGSAFRARGLFSGCKYFFEFTVVLRGFFFIRVAFCVSSIYPLLVSFPFALAGFIARVNVPMASILRVR